MAGCHGVRLAGLVVAAWLVSAPRVSWAGEEARGEPAAGLVTIESTRVGAVVERRANQVKGWSLTLPFPAFTMTEQWEPVCVTPCAMRLERNAVYKVDGVGVASSAAFVLPRGPDALGLRVQAASKLGHDAGVGATVVGVVTVVIAAIVAGGAATTRQAEPRLLYIGAPGLAVTALGAILWGANGTHVRTSDGRSL